MRDIDKICKAAAIKINFDYPELRVLDYDEVVESYESLLSRFDNVKSTEEDKDRPFSELELIDAINTTSCDEEVIRQAVSEALKVVKESLVLAAIDGKLPEDFTNLDLAQLSGFSAGSGSRENL